jgi:CHASE2 domain-containing sensor protein
MWPQLPADLEMITPEILARILNVGPAVIGFDRILRQMPAERRTRALVTPIQPRSRVCHSSP